MMFDARLQVEVSQRGRNGRIQQSLQSSVGIDIPLVFLVLQFVILDVLIDLARDIRACQKCIVIDVQKSTELG